MYLTLCCIYWSWHAILRFVSCDPFRTCTAMSICMASSEFWWWAMTMQLMESGILCEDVTLGSAIPEKKKKWVSSLNPQNIWSSAPSKWVKKSWSRVCLLSWVQTNWIIKFKCRGYHQSSMVYFVIVHRDIQDKTSWKNFVFEGMVSKRLQKYGGEHKSIILGFSCSWASSIFILFFSTVELLCFLRPYVRSRVKLHERSKDLQGKRDWTQQLNI